MNNVLDIRTRTPVALADGPPSQPELAFSEMLNGVDREALAEAAGRYRDRADLVARKAKDALVETLALSFGRLEIYRAAEIAAQEEVRREERARRALTAKGYRLQKTPARLALREEYGAGYMISEDGIVRLGCYRHPFDATIEEVEEFAREAP
jgi:hypothetical protein